MKSAKGILNKLVICRVLPLNGPYFSQGLLTGEVLVYVFVEKVVFPEEVPGVPLIFFLLDNLSYATVAPVLVEATEHQLLIVGHPIPENAVLEQPDLPELFPRLFTTQCYLVAGHVLVQSLVVLIKHWQNQFTRRFLVYVQEPQMERTQHFLFYFSTLFITTLLLF
jgi:hypothetical protein